MYLLSLFSLFTSNTLLKDTRTEEQRMEEGRRMFQIFAARMFEQRVLAAYREKVAQERQQRLLEELEEEERLREEREQKKQLEREKKKDKKRLANYFYSINTLLTDYIYY